MKHERDVHQIIHENGKKKPKLKRALGFWTLLFIGVGTILGAGIYVLIGKAAGVGGNAVWMSFGLSALLAAFTGLSYAELVSMFPKASAEYGYTEKAYGRRIAFAVGFLIIFASIVSAATVALGFGGYLHNLIDIPVIPIAVVLIIVLSGLLIYGIEESAKMAIIFTLIEMIGLVIVIVIGAPHIGSVDYFEMPGGLTSIFAASALIFFAYIGFEEIARLGEDTKNPQRVLPKALVLSIAISTILYMLVAVTTVSVIDWQVLGASKAPLADVVATAFGPNAFFIISVIALFATANTVLFIMLAGSRIMYGMSDEKILPRKLSYIMKSRRTPLYAVLVTMILTIGFALIGNIQTVAELTDFGIFAVFIIVNLVAISLRYKLPNVKRSFKVPLNIGKFPVIAALGVITSLFMMLHLNFDIILIGIGLTLLFLVIYEVYSRTIKLPLKKVAGKRRKKR